MITLVSELTNNTLNPSAQNKLTFGFKGTIPDELLAEKVQSVSINFADFGNLISGDISAAAEGRSYKIEQGLLQIKFSRLTLKDLGSKKFDISNIRIAGETIPEYAFLAFAIEVKGKPDIIEITKGKVLIQTKKPEIVSFKIVPSIITPNRKISIYFQCKNVNDAALKDGLHDSIIDSKNIRFDNEECNVSILNQRSPTIDIAIADYKKTNTYGPIELSYFLTAKYGESIVSETMEKTIHLAKAYTWMDVVPLEKEQVTDETAEHVGKRVRRTFTAIIQNVYEGKIWAIVQDTINGEKYHLWNSEDGLDWHPYLVRDARVMIPESFVHTPALFLNNNLYFAGGSMADPSQCAADVLMVDLSSGKNGIIKNNTAMPARSLHSAAVFPFTSSNTVSDNIWVIGGTDKNGNGLNDVWRFDGNKWDSVSVPASFPGRCMHSSTVLYKNGKPDSIWLAGGYNMYEGNCYYDVWAYSQENSGQWTKISNVEAEDMKFGINMNIYSSTIAAINNTSNEPSLALIFSCLSNDGTATEKFEIDSIKYKSQSKNKATYSKTLLSSETVFSDFSSEDSYRIVSLEFNGSLWAIAVKAMHNSAPEVSDLRYCAID